MAGKLTISNKKVKAISDACSEAFTEILRERDPQEKITAPGQKPWYEDSPDTWNEEEKHFFDSLNELSMRIQSKVLGIFYQTTVDGNVK